MQDTTTETTSTSTTEKHSRAKRMTLADHVAIRRAEFDGVRREAFARGYNIVPFYMNSSDEEDAMLFDELKSEFFEVFLQANEIAAFKARENHIALVVFYEAALPLVDALEQLNRYYDRHVHVVGTVEEA